MPKREFGIQLTADEQVWGFVFGLVWLAASVVLCGRKTGETVGQMAVECEALCTSLHCKRQSSAFGG